MVLLPNLFKNVTEAVFTFPGCVTNSGEGSEDLQLTVAGEGSLQ